MQKTINETKPWFLENVNKSNKTLSRLIKKKSETIQITNIINESRDLTIGFMDINMRISKYFNQLYTHKFDKLHETDQFLKRY